MSDSGWENVGGGIEMCRYEKRGLGYGAKIKVWGEVTDIPYDTHIAISTTIQSLKDENATLKARRDRDDKLHRDIMDFAAKSGALDGLRCGKTYDAYRAWEAVKDENARAMAVIDGVVKALKVAKQWMPSKRDMKNKIFNTEEECSEDVSMVSAALANAKAFKEKVK